MLFNSIQFLIFFPIVVGVYFITPQRFRWAWLLAASYYFYMSWKVGYVVLIIFSTLVDYIAGLLMEKSKTIYRRRVFLIASLIANLGLLFFFKYYNFFNDTLHDIFGAFNLFYNAPSLDILLPVGISFYTFQSLSYTIDVYRQERKAEKHLGIFALYVAFFPQLVAGPIERSSHLLPQFFQKYEFDYDRIRSGLLLMLWGFFLKVVLADRLAVPVNEVYNNVESYSGFPLILATYFFSFQIFCDFAGYSIIAIGSARVMGYDIMHNFNRPFAARSIADFWNRWHISLTTWFRDYVFYSLSLTGKTQTAARLHFNIFFVFLVSGLWHGANWTFVIWGALHGFYLLFATWTRSLRQRLSRASHLSEYPVLDKIVDILITYHLVFVAWVFFRANSVGDAFYILTHLFSGFEFNLNAIHGFSSSAVVLAIVLIGVMELIQWIQGQEKVQNWFFMGSIWGRWPAYFAILFAIMTLGVFGGQEFIYFQF